MTKNHLNGRTLALDMNFVIILIIFNYYRKLNLYLILIFFLHKYFDNGHKYIILYVFIANFIILILILKN